MKRYLVLFLIAAMVLLLAACGATEANTDETFPLPSRSTTEASEPETLSDLETEADTSEWSYPWDETGTQQTQPPQSQAQTQQNVPGATAAPQNNTTRPGAITTKPTATTKPTTTTKKPTQVFANPISITSADQALKAFNTATQNVVSKKPGFAKSHMVTYKDWELDPSLKNVVNVIPGMDFTKTFTDQIEKIMNEGTRSASAHKGDTQQILKTSGFTMNDMRSVTYSRDGSDWIITLNVKEGSTRQEKRLLSSGITGNSPIDKGPLSLAVGTNNIHDHMTADQIFSLIVNNAILKTLNIDPIDIKESTSQVKFVATLDGEGKLIGLTATYNQHVTIAEIRVLDGTTYKDNEVAGTAKIIFSDFQY